MNLQSLSEANVRELADSLPIFYRGEDYYHSDLVVRFSLSPHQITAKVQGRYGLYTIHVRDDEDNLATTCDCPYDGLVCKHIVAVLLRYLRGEERLEQRADGTGTDVLAEALTALSHQELLNLVLTLEREHPNVRRSLLAVVPISRELLHQQPQQPQRVKVLKKQISQFLNELEARSQYDDDYSDQEYDETEVYEELGTVFEEATTLHPADQIDVFWHAITAGDDLFEEYPIGTTQIEEAIRFYAAAVQKLAAPPVEKQRYLTSLLSLLDLNLAQYGDIAGAVKQALDLLCTEPETIRYLITELAEYDHQASTVDWIAGYYLQLGDDENYLSFRQAHLNHEKQYLELAHYWQQKGNPAQYLATLEAGATFLLHPQEAAAERGSGDFPFYSGYSYRQQSGLLSELAAVYRQQSDAVNLCRVLMLTAEYSGVTLKLYQEIEAVAGELGRWQELRPQLLEWLQTSAEELARVHLYEQNWQAAIALAADRGVRYESLRVLVAEGIKQHHPQEAIHLYDGMVEANIDRKQRKYYAMAAGHARAIKAIYMDILKDATGWKTYWQQVRDRYRRYPALQDEFARL